MSAEQIALAGLVLNSIVIPIAIAIARILWNHERRLTRCETKLGLKPQDT